MSLQFPKNTYYSLPKAQQPLLQTKQALVCDNAMNGSARCTGPAEDAWHDTTYPTEDNNYDPVVPDSVTATPGEDLRDSGDEPFTGQGAYPEGVNQDYSPNCVPGNPYNPFCPE